MTNAPVLSITDELIAELEELAIKATPGPWQHVEGDDNPDASWAMQFPVVTSEAQEIIGTEGFYSDKQIDEANAAFVAAANPATILALLAERAELKRDAERLNYMIHEQCVIESMNGASAPVVHRLYWRHLGEGQTEWYPSEREAIDAAMQSEAKP